MSAAEALLDWAPSAPAAVIDLVSDVIDHELVDSLSAGISDVADAAEEGVAVVAAAGEQAALSVVRLVRRRPVLSAFIAGLLVAGLLGALAKRRRSVDEPPSPDRAGP